MLYGSEHPGLTLLHGRSPGLDTRNRRLHQITELSAAGHKHFVGRTWELAGLGDEVGAITLAWGVVTALLARERLGIGQQVDTSLLRGLIGWQAAALSKYLLLGYTLPPFHRSLRKRQRKNPKFYLFDTGVKNALQHTLPYAMEPGTYPYGVAFEHWIISEFIRMNHYRRKDWQFSYLCTKDGAEIDLVVERAREPLLLIEIKSTASLHREDLSQFIKLSRDFPGAESYCLSNDRTRQKIEHVECLPWQEGLQAFFGR